MDLKAGALLVPPAVKNSSCTHPRYTGHSLFYYVGIAETIEAFFILVLTIGVIGANALIIFVINNRRYTPYIPLQPRYLLTSLALNDLAIGLLITPFGLLPALFHCWPYGEIFCQIQGCVAILSITWVISLTVFGLLVLPKGYYFNNTGLMACEPFYSKPSYRILSTCALYFPTTMVLMYCYGSSFHMSRFRLNEPVPPPTTPNHPNTITKKVVMQHERQFSGSTSRSMAAISLGFIVMVTPWTIQEIVTACTGSKLPPFLDFLVTWIALSNSFWNPFLYWLLNSHFRRLSRILLSNKWCPHEETPDHKSHCCSISLDCDHISLPLPPGPPSSRPPHGQLSIRPDIEGLSEKYWGEILERTVSSGSLHALQKSFSHHHHNYQQSSNFTKTSDLSLTICENGEQVTNFSNSEPKLCEHIYHDTNCAKSKGASNGSRNLRTLPDI